jgi:hypothetical protein
MKCAQKVRIPNAQALYDAVMDIELLKNSCFVRKHKVHVVYVDTDGTRGKNAFKLSSSGGGEQAKFIVCYSRTHACVLSREPNGALLAFDSLQFSELTQYLSSSYKGFPPITFASQESQFTHPQVQLDMASCLAISVVYVHLRAGEDLSHDAAIRKLTALKHYQIREYCFALLDIIQTTDD